MFLPQFKANTNLVYYPQDEENGPSPTAMLNDYLELFCSPSSSSPGTLLRHLLIRYIWAVNLGGTRHLTSGGGRERETSRIYCILSALKFHKFQGQLTFLNGPVLRKPYIERLVALRKDTEFPKSRPRWWQHPQGQEQESMDHINHDPELESSLQCGMCGDQRRSEQCD